MIPSNVLLLPPDLREWLPEEHLPPFIQRGGGGVGLAIRQVYESGDGRGRPPYHPLMMVKLLGCRLLKCASLQQSVQVWATNAG
jgi:hypothetical protein